MFASTNVDDIVLLSVFLADPTVRTRAVVGGQFLGIGTLVVLSIMAGLAALSIPLGWVSLLGIAPILLGLRALFRLIKKQLDPPPNLVDQEQRLQAKTGSQVLAVAAVTIANGGDNLGIYIPLFAETPGWIPLYAGIFTAMTALWCFIGFHLVKNPLLGDKISRYGHIALPFVLITLGLHILWGARVLIS